jgi:60 kDa SS-A/Ro ribonucleoprotein
MQKKEAAMKFNFNLKGRQSANARYSFVKAAAQPDTQWDLFKTLMAASLMIDDPGQRGVIRGQTAAGLVLLRETIRQCDPEFLARLIVRLRENKNFHAFSLLLTAELAALYGDEENTGVLVASIVQQAGEIPGWLEQYIRAARPGQRPGRAARRHLSVLFNRLDPYQIGRLSGEARDGLRQALLWLQPKAADRRQKALFTRLLRGQIPVRTSWEQEWHALHRQQYDSAEQRQVALRDKWKEGISSFRIGYPALLLNLQPMLCAGVSGKVLKLAAEYLGNAAAAGPAGQSPLRLLEVYRSLQRMEQGGTGMLSEALEKAALHSSWSRSEFGRESVSLIAMDVSNSMKLPVNGYENVQRFDIAPLLAFSWKNRGDQVITGVIGNNWRLIDGPAPRTDGPVTPTLSAVDRFGRREGEAGYGINAWLVLQDLLRKRQVVDRVLIFTDYQLWGNRSFNQPAGTDLADWWRQYRRQIAPEAKLYLFDLAGYGVKPLQFPEEGVCLLAGWQERMPDVLAALEKTKEVADFI